MVSSLAGAAGVSTWVGSAAGALASGAASGAKGSRTGSAIAGCFSLAGATCASSCFLAVGFLVALFGFVAGLALGFSAAAFLGSAGEASAVVAVEGFLPTTFLPAFFSALVSACLVLDLGAATFFSADFFSPLAFFSSFTFFFSSFLTAIFFSSFFLPLVFCGASCATFLLI
jgi:hypothetical protein